MKTTLTWVAALGLLAGVGCNNCEKYTEKLCADLGPEDCAAWREAGGPDSVIPGGRGVNKACGMMMDNEVGYQAILQGARSMAVANQLTKAQAAKDAAKVQQLKAKLDEIQAAAKGK